MNSIPACRLVLQIDLGLLAQLQIGVSFPVRVDSVETPSIGCLRTIIYIAYELLREEGPLRRATLRPAASTLLPLHCASSDNGFNPCMINYLRCDPVVR